MKRRIGIALALAIACSTSIAFAAGADTYLGNKLRCVVERVDNSSVEKRRVELVTRHRKAFAELGEHLTKKYPELGVDLHAWLESHYGKSIDNLGRDEKEDRLTLEALLALDRLDPIFRQRIIGYITEKYPKLFDETASFLRDNYPSALREVLRMTLRMTSHVTPCAYVTMEEPAADTGNAETSQDNLPDRRP